LNRSARLLLRVCLSSLFGIFCLPTLLYGAYLLFCWLRIHTSDVYYTNYPHLTNGSSLIAVGFLSLYATWFGVWRRSFYGLLFVAPVSVSLAAMILIQEIPPLRPSMMADSDYMMDVRLFFRVWHQDKHRFPANEIEFRDALAKGPAAWQYRVRPIPTSEYRKNGKSLPYEIVVETNATGPRLQNMSQRPGVVYYCVSEDLQEFWVTMTALQEDYGSASSIRRMGGQPNGEVMVITQQQRVIPETGN
jgi:hypothetical protein